MDGQANMELGAGQQGASQAESGQGALQQGEAQEGLRQGTARQEGVGQVPEALPKESLAAAIDREFSEELRREEGVVESLLFMMGRSVSVEEMALALNTGPEPAMAAAERLLARYDRQQGGILIQRLEDRYQMQTNPQHFDAMIRLVKKPAKPVLTDVLVETLAIIAYRQPVTKAEIERIRGVNSDHAVNRLVEYELVREAGRLNAPGRPVLFATTENFLRHFGISSLQELPSLHEDVAAAIESEAEAEIAEILGVPAEQLEGDAEDAGKDEKDGENREDREDGKEEKDGEDGEAAGLDGAQGEKAAEDSADRAEDGIEGLAEDRAESMAGEDGTETGDTGAEHLPLDGTSKDSAGENGNSIEGAAEEDIPMEDAWEADMEKEGIPIEDAGKDSIPIAGEENIPIDDAGKEDAGEGGDTGQGAEAESLGIEKKNGSGEGADIKEMRDMSGGEEREGERRGA